MPDTFNKYTKPLRGRPTPQGELTFTEIVALRRVRSTSNQREAARALRMDMRNLGHILRRARERFDVGTTAELLALPRVQELLDEGQNQ